MKIGFYSPYLDSFGGGERYILTLASHWSETHSVEVFWDNPAILTQAQHRLGIHLERVGVVNNVFATNNVIRKILTSRQYDVLFFLSDGSIPTSFAKYNLLHFQVPFAHVSVSGWKLKRFQRVICNSEFTKNNLDPNLTVERSVIYPPVDVRSISEAKKTKTILSVGRFSKAYNAKKFDVLIDAFRQAHQHYQFPGWRLILARAVLPGDRLYIQKLKFLAKGLPVEFYPNCPFEKLVTLYSSASIYWHAAGFGEIQPEHMEHFGISTVESMAAGCIPVVFAGGGQTDIVHDGKNGFLWKTVPELLEKSAQLIRKKDSLSSLRFEAKKRSQDFSVQRFCYLFDGLLRDITKHHSI